MSEMLRPLTNGEILDCMSDLTLLEDKFGAEQLGAAKAKIIRALGELGELYFEFPPEKTRHIKNEVCEPINRMVRGSGRIENALLRDECINHIRELVGLRITMRLVLGGHPHFSAVMDYLHKSESVSINDIKKKFLSFGNAILGRIHISCLLDPAEMRAEVEKFFSNQLARDFKFRKRAAKKEKIPALPKAPPVTLPAPRLESKVVSLDSLQRDMRVFMLLDEGNIALVRGSNSGSIKLGDVIAFKVTKRGGALVLRPENNRLKPVALTAANVESLGLYFTYLDLTNKTKSEV